MGRGAMYLLYTDTILLFSTNRGRAITNITKPNNLIITTIEQKAGYTWMSMELSSNKLIVERYRIAKVL